jgi:hypothetical protein
VGFVPTAFAFIISLTALGAATEVIAFFLRRGDKVLLFTSITY